LPYLDHIVRAESVERNGNIRALRNVYALGMKLNFHWTNHHPRLQSNYQCNHVFVPFKTIPNQNPTRYSPATTRCMPPFAEQTRDFVRAKLGPDGQSHDFAGGL
jgi:hypothetical protein